ncbi:MAG: nucleotidyltransferase family protein [Proteobacteria bacterium]|nr:nucleotidyltransferase family protein [Pseudomonadota bacterium]MDA0983294.1 nucleotidyltransferase family protein [Pseudomonadota bacterium]
MKAMLLAAGRGERMRPQTDTLPKPLLEAGGKPLLAWHLERLAAAGFREVVINVSWLGERIVERFGDGADYGLAIAWSRESPAPLETAGGIAAARPLLGETPFLLVNADVYADCDLARLAAVRLDDALAHLVLVPNPEHHPHGDFSLAGGIVGEALAPRYTYAGIAVLSPRIVAGVAPGARAPLGPLLHRAAADGCATGELHAGTWCDVGTPQRLSALDANLRKGNAAP